MIALKSILEEINKKIQEFSKDYSYDPGYSKCKYYVDHNGMRRVEDIVHIDIDEFMQCYLYVSSNGRISLEQADVISDTILRWFNFMDEKDIHRLICTMIITSDILQDEDVLNYLMEPIQSKANRKLSSIPNDTVPLKENSAGVLEDISFRDLLEELRLLEQSRGGIKVLVDLLCNEPDIAVTVFGFFITRRCIENDLKQMEKDKASMLGMRKKDLRRSERDFFRSYYSGMNIPTIHSAVSSFVTQQDCAKREYDRSRSKRTHTYDRVTKLLLEADQQEEIKNAREIVKGIPDDDIKKMILLWILQKNNQLYHQLDGQLEELNSHSINHYIAILNRYHVGIDVSDIPSIMHHMPEELDEILRALPYDLVQSNQLLCILQMTNTMVARKVRDYLTSGYFEKSCLLANIDLFHSSMEKLQRLEASCEILSNYGINPQLFSKTPELLWDPYSILPNNIVYLNDYNLISAIRTTNELEFLRDPVMVEKIDLLIELGYYSILEQNIGLLNFSKERIERLELLRAMNIPIEDSDTLYEVLSNSKFVVKDDKLEQYLLDVVPYKKPLELNLSVEELESRYNDKIALPVGNSILSIPKIKRRVSQGETIGQAIFYGRHYSEEEYNQIVQGLSSYSRR